MNIPDPPVRPDGLCANCGKPRKHAVANKYSGTDAIQDPFCSTGCARDWHGNPLPSMAGVIPEESP